MLIHVVWHAVTALGKSQLRSLPAAKLRRYVDAYNIQIKGTIDKNDIVDLVVAARVCPSAFLSPTPLSYGHIPTPFCLFIFCLRSNAHFPH